MLGRTANGIYWMFRYIERAENAARLIDAGLRMSLTRNTGGDEDWDSILQSSGVHGIYCDHHEMVTAQEAIDFLLRARTNPSSVLSSVSAARGNGRMVRTALTREAWEAVNECWIELSALLGRRVRDTDLPAVIDSVKRWTSLIRGAFHGTMLRNDIYNFARIGTFIERADNTARILDVKYYVLLPAATYVGSSLDNAQWESILRSVSAHRSYQWAYDTEYRAINIADFLILNARMPRSLAYCHNKISSNLEYLAGEYGERHAVHETASAIQLALKNRRIEEVFDHGLHEFLDDFVARNNRLGNEIAEAYRFY